MLGSETARFLVVVNHASRFPMWPEDREPPVGWRAHGARGTRGTRGECLNHIREHGKDTRPPSLRRALAECGA